MQYPRASTSSRWSSRRRTDGASTLRGDSRSWRQGLPGPSRRDPGGGGVLAGAILDAATISDKTVKLSPNLFSRLVDVRSGAKDARSGEDA
jgi:hypothetical protein